MLISGREAGAVGCRLWAGYHHLWWLCRL